MALGSEREGVVVVVMVMGAWVGGGSGMVGLQEWDKWELSQLPNITMKFIDP